jgi:soluble lytic murein transglycosylase
VNVKLGCKLLSSLRAMFPQRPELAIPSYNAGAGATHRWVTGRQHDAFDLWVEDIPYDETRGYTKRVLSSVLVYAYLYEPEHMTEALALPHTID